MNKETTMKWTLGTRPHAPCDRRQRYPLHTMQAGDWIVGTNVNFGGVWNAIRNFKRNTGREFVTYTHENKIYVKRLA